MKNAQTWISAALYIALGIIILTIVLAAGMPVINELKDKNTFLQTKDVMFGLNKAIRTVISEGPGSQRVATITIGRGDFKIDEANDIISWQMETKATISAPNKDIPEGNLIIRTDETVVLGKYVVSLKIPYNVIADIELLDNTDTFTGRNSFVIKNQGLSSATNKPNITLRLI